MSQLHQCDQEMLPNKLSLKYIEGFSWTTLASLFFQKTYLAIFLAFIPQTFNEGTLQGQMSKKQQTSPKTLIYCVEGSFSTVHSDDSNRKRSLNFTYISHTHKRNATNENQCIHQNVQPGVNGIGPIQVLYPTDLFLQQGVESFLLYTNLIIALGKKRTGQPTMTMLVSFLLINKLQELKWFVLWTFINWTERTCT